MKKCPRCGKMRLKDERVLNSLSRRDSKTHICNDCSREEAFIDGGIMPPNEIERNFIATHH